MILAASLLVGRAGGALSMLAPWIAGASFDREVWTGITCWAVYYFVASFIVLCIAGDFFLKGIT